MTKREWAEAILMWAVVGVTSGGALYLLASYFSYIGGCAR